MGRKRDQKEIKVVVEFTPGYQQRVTAEILKIYEKREREKRLKEAEKTA